MKSYKEYLAESKKVYEFKVKIAGDCAKDCAEQIKKALSQFHVENCSTGRSTPIQEHLAEFPEHKHTSMTVFDVTTSYPANSLQVRTAVATQLGKAESMVKVRNILEEKEHEINHEHDTKTGKALVGTDYDASNHQSTVGEKHKENFLKELSKVKHQGTQYKGVNDEILASGAPKSVNEKPGKTPEIKTKFTNLFSKTKHVDPIKGTR
jgi:hypothetical protein